MGLNKEENKFNVMKDNDLHLSSLEFKQKEQNKLLTQQQKGIEEEDRLNKER